MLLIIITCGWRCCNVTFPAYFWLQNDSVHFKIPLCCCCFAQTAIQIKKVERRVFIVMLLHNLHAPWETSCTLCKSSHTISLSQWNLCIWMRILSRAYSSKIDTHPGERWDERRVREINESEKIYFTCCAPIKRNHLQTSTTHSRDCGDY